MADQIPYGDLTSWSACRATSVSFNRWWGEWKCHLFNRPSKIYCLSLYPDFDEEDPEDDLEAPANSRSGRPIVYDPVSTTTNLGVGALTPSAFLSGKRAKAPERKCKASTVTTPRVTRARSDPADTSTPISPPLPSAPTLTVVVTPTDAAAEANTPVIIPNTTDVPAAIIADVDVTATAAVDDDMPADAAAADADTLATAVADASTLRPATVPSIAVDSNAPAPEADIEEEDDEARSHTIDVDDGNVAEEPCDSSTAANATLVPDRAEAADSFTRRFPFDINHYLQAEEVIGAPQPAPLTPEVKEVLTDILNRLKDPVENLVNDSGPVRARFKDIMDHLPVELVDMLMLAVHLEFHWPSVTRAQQRMADRVSQRL